MIKKLKMPVISMAVALTMLFAFPVVASSEVKVFINGEEIFYAVPAQIVSDRVMTPPSETIEALTGTSADWDEETGVVTFQANGHTNSHTIGESVIYIDDEPVEFPTPSMMADGGPLVPIRMIAEATGYNVGWDADNYHVLITNDAEAEELANLESAEEEAVTEEAETEETETEETVAEEAETEETVAEETEAEKPEAEEAVAETTTTEEVAEEATDKAATTEVAKDEAAADNATAGTAIVSVVPDKDTITAGDEVKLTITTDSEIADVWIDCDNVNIDATFDFIDASGNRVWSVSCSPTESQRLHIFASEAESGAEYQMEIQYIEVLPAE